LKKRKKAQLELNSEEPSSDLNPKFRIQQQKREKQKPKPWLEMEIKKIRAEIWNF
jgi:hypothetical protein